ncbi:hypothetical protein AB3U99_11245 [Niallia sp. JL1B1071]
MIFQLNEIDHKTMIVFCFKQSSLIGGIIMELFWFGLLCWLLVSV